VVFVVRKLIVFFWFFLVGFILASCSHTASKQNKSQPQEVHLQQKTTPANEHLAKVPIPKPVLFRPILPKPSSVKQQKLYSVSAIRVPVDRLLFKLAVDANRQLSLSSGIKGKVTLFVKNKPLDFIVKQVAQQVGANYLVSPQLIKVYPDKAYWQSYRVDYVNLLKKTKDETLLNMAVGGGSKGEGNSAQGNQSTVTVESKHDFWGALEKSIRGFIEDKVSRNDVGVKSLEKNKKQKVDDVQVSKSEQSSKVLINKEAGLVSVYANSKKQSQIKAFLDQVFSRSNKQVLIEATVVEVELSDRYQAGIDWSALSSSSNNTLSIAQKLVGVNLSTSPAFSINLANSNGSGFSFDLGLKMLQKFGKTKVLSSPKIMAINNQMALLKVVDNQVYFTVQADTAAGTNGGAAITTFSTEVHTVPVGFMMSVTPFVSDDDSISLNIRPTLSRIISYVNDPNPSLAQNNIISKIPVIQEREMSSMLRLRDKQTAIIGGLIQDLNSKDNAGVPLLKDIPWVGELFKYRDDKVTKSELVIFIRPVIVKNPDIDFGDLKSLKRFLPKQRVSR